MDASEENPLTYDLEQENELRFEVAYGKGNEAFVKVLSGTAELFGTELALEHTYSFSGVKHAIYTWHGCKVALWGKFSSTPYTSAETPMVAYLNTHRVLEARRDRAKSEGRPGPRVCIVGPTDVGKSSLSKILVGYATRQGRRPLFVDLDVGQGSISVPGAIAAMACDRPVDPEEGFVTETPLIYYSGQPSPGDNKKLYESLMAKLNNVVTQRIANDPLKESGLIVNTCGWVEGDGFTLLLNTLSLFNADVVLFMGPDRLYNDLRSKVPKGVDIVNLPKSGGVVSRDGVFRKSSRDARVKDYFYGTKHQFNPRQQVLNTREIKVMRIGGGPQAPEGTLPIGQKAIQDPEKLYEVKVTNDLVGSLLAVTHAKSLDQVMNMNVAGFLHVIEVNAELETITVLAPCPGRIPSPWLITGKIKFLE